MLRRRKITREGGYYLLMLGAIFVWGVLREANLLILAAGMLSSPMLLNWWLCKAALRGLEVHRRMPGAVTANTPVHVEFEIRNTRRRRGVWGVTIQDRCAGEGNKSAGPAIEKRLFVLSLPAGQQRRLRYRLLIPRRGRYHLGPLTLVSRFPFGLFSCSQSDSRNTPLIVYPRLGTLSAAWRRRYDPRQQGERGSHRPGRAAGDFYAVREWQTGDSPRWIHWRRTARQGRLIVRQFEQPGGAQFVLLVDLSDPGRRTGEREDFERAISFAATIVTDFCRQPGLQLRVGLAGEKLEWMEGGTSLALQARILERLAVVEPAEGLCAVELFRRALEALPDQADVWLVRARSEGVPLGEPSAYPLAQRSRRFQEIGPRDRLFQDCFKVS